MLAVMFELAKRVAERSPPVNSTSTASAFAMSSALSVIALTSSREYMVEKRTIARVWSAACFTMVRSSDGEINYRTADINEGGRDVPRQEAGQLPAWLCDAPGVAEGGWRLRAGRTGRCASQWRVHAERREESRAQVHERFDPARLTNCPSGAPAGDQPLQI